MAGNNFLPAPRRLARRLGRRLGRAGRYPQLIVAVVIALLAALVVVAAPSPARAAGSLLSQGKPATASSTENAGTPASAAVDGNPGTRWSSAYSDPQWLQVDLGASASVSQVVLQWEAAYATAFQIQTSNDGTTWTSIYATTTGTGGTQTLSVTGTGRYVRMDGTARATGYGYSLVTGARAADGPACCLWTSYSPTCRPISSRSSRTSGTRASRWSCSWSCRGRT